MGADLDLNPRGLIVVKEIDEAGQAALVGSASRDPPGAAAEGCEWQGTRAELNSHAAGCLHLRCQGQIRRVRADSARYQEELRRKHVASQAEVAHLQEARQRVEARLAEVVEKLGRAESREATHAQRLVVARTAALREC